MYADFSQPGNNEDSPVGTLTPEEIETAREMKDITGLNYGPLKALCEQEAEKAFPGRCCNIRPGLIVGPRDRSDRFTYWPVRMARGGEVLAPGTPDDLTQYIDVRDLAEFMVHCVERGLISTQRSGPEGEKSCRTIVCRQASSATTHTRPGAISDSKRFSGPIPSGNKVITIRLK